MPAAKNAASKNHPKDILRDKNYLYGIVLVHIVSNVVFKTIKHFQIAGYWIFKNCKNLEISFNCFTNCLTTSAKLDAKWSIVQPQFYGTYQWDVPFGVPGSLHLSFPFIFYETLLLYTISMHKIFHSTLSLSSVASYLAITTSILKCLCYSRAIIWVQDSNEKLVEMGMWQHRMYGARW